MLETRLLGQTGLVVTPLGLGLAALGRPGYINLGHASDLEHEYDVEAMEAHAHTVLDAAWEAGIRYFDAARSYGRAEAFLGSWLESRGIAPDQVTVGSKWGYTYTADWQVDADVHEVKEHSLAVLRRQRGESDALLGDYLNLYQIHSATLSSGVLDNTEVLAELARYKAEGLHVGLTLSGPRQAETLRRAMAVAADGRPLFETVQITWNLLEPSTGPILQEASEQGMGVIVKEALANGRLTDRNDDPAFAEQRRLLDEVAKENQTTVDALALAAVLAQPWVSVVLSGAAQVDHLHSNLGAFTLTWDADMAARLSALAEPPAQYWQIRSELPWN
jgi:aryl-alcohol dehydrogenase-like predicted oxidoreductase